MKAEQRAIYFELTNEIGFELCAFCRHSATYGSACDCIETECHHPIENVPGHDEYLAPGDDCWGFRPKYTVSFIADLVGVVLSKGWASASWWKNEDGVYEIAGVA